MSITFPTEYQSDFPDSIDTFARMEDISPEDLPFLVEYYRLMNIGNFNAAKQLILSNPQLNTKFMNANKWNQIRDAIIAVQKYFMTYEFTGSGTQTRGTWNSGVNYLIDFYIVGGGAGRFTVASNRYGGGGGYCKLIRGFKLEAATYAITIGTGGAGGMASTVAATASGKNGGTRFANGSFSKCTQSQTCAG